MRELDRTDRKILTLLQQDGRMALTELAERIGLSTTPTSERVKRLERDGVIEGYYARVNPRAVACAQLVFVELRLAAKSAEIFDQFRREVMKLPNIVECHLVSGDFDYLVKARISDMSQYRTLLGDILLNLPGAVESRSYVVMEEVKETLVLPVAAA
ncbi:Lrp/AsnC ligand binding domain-containing protein [Chitinimonas koreensis]|uniref:Lrp/AsnC ligand binding domain-containing protein n=1 Tax=Chitinimonas koreensis TaxID=356302 RepID=UPI000415D96C|nr:Lrp/AsnC ligand binding domain-containing protein [Chitinimonas koreensis]QNM94707.1 Lrp/AsnC ligand binding domain-containing protein [Chitinimonas koreensis]